MNIITNGHERDELSWWDLTLDQQQEFIKTHGLSDKKDEKGGLPHDCPTTFYPYKGNLFTGEDFLPVKSIPGDDNHFEGWDGYASDSFFSGTLIRFNHDDDTVVMGWYFC